MEGKCLTNSDLYKATVTYNYKELYYIGSTAKHKSRYNKHMHSFINKNLKESKQFNSFIETANEDMVKNNVKWEIKKNQPKPSRYDMHYVKVER